MSVVQCSDLSKRYGATRALDGIDLALDAGPPVALVGPNGAGKTTLLSILCGYIRPSAGVARVLGQAPGSRSLLGRVSALPQDAALDPRFTIARQLRHYADLQGMGRRQAGLDVGRVLELVQLAQASTQKPHALSHGMRKRVLIAQTFLGTPELVLLDEPTSGLDPQNVKIVRELIASTSDKINFLISSHNLDEVEKLCASVLHISDGRLKEQVQITGSEREGYLSLVLHRTGLDPNTVVESLSSLPGVSDVDAKSQDVFVLQYDSQRHPELDQTLLRHLSKNDWPYRQLINGRGLEDRLYS